MQCPELKKVLVLLLPWNLNMSTTFLQFLLLSRIDISCNYLNDMFEYHSIWKSSVCGIYYYLLFSTLMFNAMENVMHLSNTGEGQWPAAECWRWWPWRGRRGWTGATPPPAWWWACWAARWRPRGRWRPAPSCSWCWSCTPGRTWSLLSSSVTVLFSV